MTRYNDMTELIGNTPAVKLHSVVPEDCADIFVKLEFFNPSRSVKDRAAYNMIKKAEEDGIIKPGDTVIEPTSGNTGIGLAMNAAAQGYRGRVVQPEKQTEEGREVWTAHGDER